MTDTIGEENIMTYKQRDRLVFLVKKMRETASKIGPMHSWWDTIFDIEAFLESERTILNKSVEEWISYSENLLNKKNKSIL